MAREINLQFRLTASKSGARISSITNLVNDMAGGGMNQLTQSIGFAAPEAVVLGELDGVPGYVAIINLDATNYVTVGGDAALADWTLKIPKGGIAVLPLTAAALWAQANTAAVRVQVVSIDL